ncbi:hypothetical protein [uncultured Thiohalocapsa sp.]|uniref:hypothetical protein n=1 Tax=uncultured Thiohalocapsa sp. TaxID=768990 RepID=UPI0025EFAF81|nr:hypothetical protein [uncultured Thiohalocapsa sp.]
MLNLLGWINLVIVGVMLLGLGWVSPLGALLLLLLLAAAAALTSRLLPRGAAGARLRRGLRPGAARRRRGAG